MALTLDEAKTLRAAWMAAELAVATSQSYTLGGRELTRADAKFITAQLSRYDRIVTSLEAGRGGGVGVFRVMPRDL